MTTTTDFEVLHVPPRWLFVRLEASDGEVSWGECVTGIGPRNVAATGETLAEARLLGKGHRPARSVNGGHTVRP